MSQKVRILDLDKLEQVRLEEYLEQRLLPDLEE